QSAEDAAAIVLAADTGHSRQRGATVTGLPVRRKRATRVGDRPVQHDDGGREPTGSSTAVRTAT
ncbi:hypothetical protein, partial [Actinomadura sp. LOL_011]